MSVDIFFFTINKLCLCVMKYLKLSEISVNLHRLTRYIQVIWFTMYREVLKCMDFIVT